MTPMMYFERDCVIRAIPTIPGQYVQEKTFEGVNGYGSSSSAQEVPARVFFDMWLVPVYRPGLDVRVIE